MGNIIIYSKTKSRSIANTTTSEGKLIPVGVFLVLLCVVSNWKWKVYENGTCSKSERIHGHQGVPSAFGCKNPPPAREIYGFCEFEVKSYRTTKSGSFHSILYFAYFILALFL